MEFHKILQLVTMEEGKQDAQIDLWDIHIQKQLFHIIRKSIRIRLTKQNYWQRRMHLILKRKAKLSIHTGWSLAQQMEWILKISELHQKLSHRDWLTIKMLHLSPLHQIKQISLIGTTEKKIFFMKNNHNIHIIASLSKATLIIKKHIKRNKQENTKNNMINSLRKLKKRAT